MPSRGKCTLKVIMLVRDIRSAVHVEAFEMAFADEDEDFGKGVS